MKISVITATLNSISNIKKLYLSLKEQTDKKILNGLLRMESLLIEQSNF